MNFNPADIMKNIKEVQKNIVDVTAEGSSGGGLVKIELNGELQMTNITIDPIAVDPRDIDMLQDLIIAAMNSAQANIKEKIKDKMSESTGINLPFDLKGFV